MCVIYMSWCGGEWKHKYVLCFMFMVSIWSVVEYVSGIVYVMVRLVFRFIWVVKMCWGLKVWVGIYVVWCVRIYRLDRYVWV